MLVESDNTMSCVHLNTDCVQSLLNSLPFPLETVFELKNAQAQPGEHIGRCTN